MSAAYIISHRSAGWARWVKGMISTEAHRDLTSQDLRVHQGYEGCDPQLASDVSYDRVTYTSGGSNEQSVSEHYSGTHRHTRRAASISLEAKTLVVNPHDRRLDSARPVAGFRARIGDRSLYLHPLLMITTYLSWAGKWKR